MNSFFRSHVQSILLALILQSVALASPRQEPGRPLRFVGNDKIPPILFVQNGKPAGLAVDLAYAAAEKADLSIRVEAMDWPEAQSLVSAGKADALLQINSSPERDRIYDFSDTLLESRFHIFRKNTRLDIQNLSSLYGKKVGVEAGGFPLQYLRAHGAIQLVVVPNWKDGFEKLQAEQLDAVFIDRWVGEYALYRHKIGGIILVDPPVVADYSRIAVKKGSRELLERINSGLREIERDGTRQKILEKWQAKEVVYVTREWIERMAHWAALVCVVLLVVITQRALAHSRKMKKFNRELADRSNALTREIEERKQAEAALQRAHDTLEHRVAERTAELRQSEERYRLIFETANEGIWVTDGERRTILVNQRMADMLGYTIDELQGRIPSEFLHAGQESIVQEVRQELTAGATTRYEFRFRRKDGSDLWVLSGATPLRDSESRLIKTVSMLTDITERKQAEELLRDSETKYRNLFENMSEEVHFWKLVRDEEGRIQTWRLVDANAPTIKTWGRSTIEEIRGKTTDEIFGPGATEHYRAVVEKIMTEGSPHSFEDYFAHLDKHFRFNSVPLDGHFITTGADITALKKAQEALRAINESLEQRVTERTAEVQRQADQLRALAAELTQAEQRERKRLAKILHDHIQQLLVAARMQVEWMRRDSRPERLQATLQGVDSILKEALDASRSLTVELSPPVLHEAGLIGGLNWLAARTLERNQFEVILSAENRAEPPTEATRLLLFECVRELLLNAVKHSGASQAHVTLLRTSTGHIRLITSDEGHGFDPDLLKMRRPDEASFGLFSIQQRLIHLGGQMEIATAPGKGTRVTLTLPAGEAQTRAEAPSGAAPAQTRPKEIVVREKTAMHSILVVDDHKIVREGLVSLMQFEPDIKVVGQAADGRAAVELATRLKPDAIVMDINLGEGMNGVEATKRILSANPSIRIIGLSMHTENDVAAAMRDAGAVAHLTKGGPSEDLIAAIRAACAE